MVVLRGDRTINDYKLQHVLGSDKYRPALPDEIRAAWSGVSDTLGQRLAAVSAADLDKPITTDMLLEHKTTLGMLVFLVQHDSYHIGQLSLLRKYAGAPPGCSRSRRAPASPGWPATISSVPLGTR